MNKNLYAYKTIDTATKSKFKLMAQIYEGTIKKIREAIGCYQKKDFDTGYEALEKAKSALVYLYGSLDTDKGGEVAEKMGQLYVFVIERINLVESTKDTAVLNDCIGILDNIRSAWEELAQREKKQESDSDSPMPETKKTKRLSVSL